MHFSHLPQLDKHIKKLSTILESDIFLVGGCVRDLLLWMNTNPVDIDATCAMQPTDVFKKLQKNAGDSVWLFRTEKFWTATLITQEEEVKYSYEITPLREEWGYTDRRHPTEIQWTNSIISDADRRDFTINCLYYISLNVNNENSSDAEPVPAKKKKKSDIEYDKISTTLEKKWWIYLAEYQLLILQSEDVISDLFPQGTHDTDKITAFMTQQGIAYIHWDALRILIDPKLGFQDMIIQKIRTVWNPDKRFNEDALRILRALRFVNIRNQYGLKFDFNKETRNSIKKNYHLIQYLAKERIHDELVKVFTAKNPFGYVSLLDEVQVLQYIFPALSRCKYNDQPVRYHPFDTYTHILLTLWNLQQINSNYLVKLGMLYHDVWKPDQYHYYAQCKTKEEIEALHGSRANHTVCGPEFAQRDFQAIGFSSKEIEEISWYVAMHMRPWQILEAREDNQLKKVRLLYSEYGYDRVKNLIDICKADRLWQYNPIQSWEIENVENLYKHLDHLRDTEWQFTIKDMIVKGDTIMKEFNLSPSKQVGELLEKAFQRVVHEKDNRNTSHAILSYLKGIITHGN